MGSALRVLQYQQECQLCHAQERPSDLGHGRRQEEEEEEEGPRKEDVQLMALVECTCELLASMLVAMSRVRWIMK